MPQFTKGPNDAQWLRDLACASARALLALAPFYSHRLVQCKYPLPLRIGKLCWRVIMLGIESGDCVGR